MHVYCVCVFVSLLLSYCSLIYCPLFYTFRVPKIEVETHKVRSPGVVVPTLDTVRHESLLYMWLVEH